MIHVRIWWLNKSHTGWAIMFDDGSIQRVVEWRLIAGHVRSCTARTHQPIEAGEEAPFAWLDVIGEIVVGEPVK